MKKSLVFVFVFCFFIFLFFVTQKPVFAANTFDNNSGPGVIKREQPEAAQVEEAEPEQKPESKGQISSISIINFVDIDKDHPDWKAVQSCFNKGIKFPWDGDREFQPEKIVTREEFAQILFNVYGSRIKPVKNVGFDGAQDIQTDGKYNDAIRWVINTDIMPTGSYAGGISYLGKTDGKYFEPSMQITINAATEYLYKVSMKLNIEMPKTHELFDITDPNQDLVQKALSEGKYYRNIDAFIRAGIIQKNNKGGINIGDLTRGELLRIFDRYTDIAGLGI